MLTRNLCTAWVATNSHYWIKMWYSSQTHTTLLLYIVRCDKSIKVDISSIKYGIKYTYGERNTIWRMERLNKWLGCLRWYDFSISISIMCNQWHKLYFIIQFYSDHARMSIDFVDINWTKERRKRKFVPYDPNYTKNDTRILFTRFVCTVQYQREDEAEKKENNFFPSSFSLWNVMTL